MSDVSLNEDEQAVRLLARDFFAGRAPLVRQQELAARHETNGGTDDNGQLLHAEMGKLDFFTQAVPQDAGGLGLSILASGLIAEAAGRELVPGPWLDQLVAVRMVAPHGEDAVAPFASADLLAAVAFATGSRSRFSWNETAQTVSGHVGGLRFGDTVNRWVLATTGATLVVDPGARGVGEVRLESSIDPLTRSASVQLNDVSPEFVVRHGPRGFQDHLGLAVGLVAAFSVGAAARVLDEATNYVKERQQFGRPIGSFQAIKHRAANAYIELLHARSLAHAALADGEPTALSAARIAADRCFRHVAEAALQMHGGIGFTSDVPIHLFLKSSQGLRAWPRPVDDELDAVRAHLRLDDSMRSVPA